MVIFFTKISQSCTHLHIKAPQHDFNNRLVIFYPIYLIVSFIIFQGKYVPPNILSDLVDLSCIELHGADHLSSSLHTELNQLAGLQRTARINSVPYVSPDINLVRYSAFELDNTRSTFHFIIFRVLLTLRPCLSIILA